MNKCQNVECNNIGRKVTVQMIMKGTNKEEIHDIYMCQICINIQNFKSGGFKN